MTILEKMKTDWDRRAQTTPRYWVDVYHWRTDDEFAQAGRDVAAAIMQFLPPAPACADWRVLDLGCGVGRVMREIASQFQSVAGVDVSSEMLRHGRPWLAAAGNVSTHEGAGADLSMFPDATFDCAYSSLVVQHLPKPVFVSYAAEVNRVLKPSGRFLFQALLGHSLDAAPGDTIALQVYHPQEMLEHLTDAGFHYLRDHCESQDPRGFGSWWTLFQKVAPARPAAAPCSDWACEPDAEMSPVDILMYQILLAQQLLREEAAP